MSWYWELFLTVWGLDLFVSKVPSCGFKDKESGRLRQDPSNKLEVSEALQ